MKVTDLMVGDWVLDGTQIAQITSITFGGVIETTAHEISNIEVIEPIPLTGEILEKNGWIEWKEKKLGATMFTQHFEFGENLLGIEDSIEIRIDRDPYGNFHFMCNGESFCYLSGVHELQHALRLLGIEKEIVVEFDHLKKPDC